MGGSGNPITDGPFASPEANPEKFVVRVENIQLPGDNAPASLKFHRLSDKLFSVFSNAPKISDMIDVVDITHTIRWQTSFREPVREQ